MAKQAAEKEAAAKAMLEAEEAAKKASANAAAANKTLAPHINDNTTPVAEEPKSLLAVPFEAAPVEPPAVATQAAAAVADVPPPAAEMTQSVAPVSEPARELVPAKAAPVVSAPAENAAEAKPAEALPVTAAPAEAPVKAPYYQSESGMQFDRQLQFEVEQEEPATLPTGPRTGNKVAPKPKELPQENDPSFFDRMLEKIGF